MVHQFKGRCPACRATRVRGNVIYCANSPLGLSRTFAQRAGRLPEARFGVAVSPATAGGQPPGRCAVEQSRNRREARLLHVASGSGLGNSGSNNAGGQPPGRCTVEQGRNRRGGSPPTCVPGVGAALNQRCLSRRSLSRCQSRSLMAARLSYCFLPLANAILSLARPCFQYRDSGTRV